MQYLAVKSCKKQEGLLRKVTWGIKVTVTNSFGHYYIASPIVFIERKLMQLKGKRCSTKENAMKVLTAGNSNQTPNC